jgi:general secretion pathway protein K
VLCRRLLPAERQPCDDHDPERGVILVAALWLLILLAVIGAGMIELVRSERRIARQIAGEAEARALADAGIARAIGVLLDRGAKEAWPIDGGARPVSHDGGRISVAISDEFGKIDLNTGSDDLLRGLFRSADLSESEAETVVERIADWRDADDNRRLNGAERAEYEARQLAYGPRNGAFESIDELGQVLGLRVDLLEKVRPALTVFSRSTSIDTATAPREVLLAMPGMDDASVRRRMAERRSAAGAAGASTIGTTAAIADLSGRAFTLIARATTSKNTMFTRTAIVRFTGDPARPYWMQQ